MTEGLHVLREGNSRVKRGRSSASFLLRCLGYVMVDEMRRWISPFRAGEHGDGGGSIGEQKELEISA